MEQSDKRAFKAQLEILGLAFGREFDTPLLQVWWQALEDIPIGRISSAVALAVRECERFPTPARLRALARAQAVPELCPALPAIDAERDRVRDSWKGKTQEVKELCSKLPKGPARAMAEKLAKTAGGDER